MNLFKNFLLGVTLSVIGTSAFTADLTEQVKSMITLEMMGNPDGRIGLSTEKKLSVSRFKNGYFDWASDPLVIAKKWRFAENPIPTKCHKNRCAIVVLYDVVGVTRGEDAPSWMRPKGREIVALPLPKTERVTYEFLNKQGVWKIDKFPLPHVQQDALLDAFKNDIQNAESKVPQASVDTRLVRQQEIMKTWRNNQIRTLEKMGTASP